MFEVITNYTVENEIDIMGLRSELSYALRSKNIDDTHVISSVIHGEKTYITLIYVNIDPNIGDNQSIMEYMQEYSNGYMVNTDGILILDYLEFRDLDYNRHWLYDAINLIGGRIGKFYVSVDDISKPEDKLEDPDYLVAYGKYREEALTKIKGLWDGMWMKGIGSYMNKGWPIEQGEYENWFKVKEHIPRIMGDHYMFYSRRLRGINKLTFRIPYNFSIIHEICNSLPNSNMTIDGGFLTIHDGIDRYDDIVNISNVIERALLVKYKTADYWGDDVDNVMKPWSDTFNVVNIKINSYMCYLSKIPNVITVEDGRKMIAYVINANVMKK